MTLSGESDTETVMAIMRGVNFGVSDRGSVCMWFQTYVTESSAALQVLSVEQAVELIAAAGVKDVHELEGKPCWVAKSASTMRFLRYAKVGR